MQPKILLVDDREDNLLSIEAVLSADSYQVFKAASGRDALKILLEEVDFALILMDVIMPVLNGFETAKLIHERVKLKSIPIIFITANNYGDENIYQGYQAGGIDYILKPINPDVLRAKVSVFVNLYEKNKLLIEKEQKLKSINEILGIELNDRKQSELNFKNKNEEMTARISQLETMNRKLRRVTLVTAFDLHDPLARINKILSQTDSHINEKSDELVDQLKKEVEHIKHSYMNILALSKITGDDLTFSNGDLKVSITESLKEMEQES